MNRRTALMILDVQNLFFSEKAPIHRGEEIMGNIMALQKMVQFSGGTLILTQHLFGDMFGFQIDGTAAGEIRLELLNSKPKVYIKNTPDPFLNQELMTFLQDQGIENLIITGFQTEYCIDTACRRAKSLGFKVTLVADGHSTYSNPFMQAEDIINHTNYTIQNAFATLVHTQELMKGGI